MEATNRNIWDNRFAGLLLEAMAEGVFTLDPEGRITSWNPAMEKITGYSAAEALGQPCSILNFNQCFTRKCPEDIRLCKIFSDGGVNAKECRLVHKNGQLVPVVKNARVVKDVDQTVIGVVETVTDMRELIHAREKADEVRFQLAETCRFSNIVGKSRVMREIYRSITAAAKSEATILIQGESGTGKELVAGAIHYNSDRSGAPLVSVNCSALSETLLESELFGHVRGAFTGAHKDRKGRFEEADGGTLFLDEIGEISPFIQLKLLRALQEGQIERVGESRKKSLDLRIIAATNKDLLTLVQKGHFREDLYYRLKVYPINMPALRRRKEDIPLLVDHFIAMFNSKTGRRITGVDNDALKNLMAYDWPGNVRELKNAVEHAFVVCVDGRIGAGDLPAEIRRNKTSPCPVRRADRMKSTGDPGALTKAELLSVLDACGWNKAEAGRRLGLSRVSIWKYMKKWDIPLKG